jgi:hypothetical protein
VFTQSDEVIVAALEDQPFRSVRQFTWATHLAVSTAYSHLTQKLEYTVRHLHWVPHTLSAADKLVRAQFLPNYRITRSPEDQVCSVWGLTPPSCDSWYLYSRELRSSRHFDFISQPILCLIS